MRTEQRLTRAQKNAGNKQWFKDKIDEIETSSALNQDAFAFAEDGNTPSKRRKLQINYDLFNNKIDMTDFQYVIKPFGQDVGDLPADFTNKDIISGKIKALLGMEMKRPFSWKVLAVNEEATTRKEQAEFGMIKEFVISSIMMPIQQMLEEKYLKEQSGKELSPDEQRQIQEQIQQELKTMTPPEVKKYMQREHQDPAEVLAHQLLEYLLQKEQIPYKFNKGWKHNLISGEEVFWVGENNRQSSLKVINRKYFDYDKSPDSDFIEDGEWAIQEMFMLPSEFIAKFSGEFSDVEIDDIISDYETRDGEFNFGGVSTPQGIRVIHAEWKALKPVNFLTYQDLETGEVHLDIVDESYKLNPEAGDINISKEWILSKYEGYRAGRDSYAYLREVPGQNKSLDNLQECKLSYMGASCDSLNSEMVSLLDRMKYYQYFYNILLYRIELLTASDKGKQLLLNLNMIPKNSGIDIKKWYYFLETTKVGWLDPNEEGNKGGADVSNAAKEIDMSLISDIQKYVTLAEYIEKRCGESVGITKQIEGQIGSNEAVGNTQVALVNSANILEPYFEMHNMVKRNVLDALLNLTKVLLIEYKPKYLSYILDDMSIRMLEIDYDLLENSVYGLFVANSAKSSSALQAMERLSHAALQNQKIEMSDVIKVLRSDSVQQAEELLNTAEAERLERESAQQDAALRAKADAEEKAREFKREEWKHDLAKIRLEESLKTDREIQKQLILSMGFNEDKDIDKDGLPDVFEIAKFNLEADFKMKKQALDEKKQMHQEQNDKAKNELAAKKLKNDAAKNNASK